MSGLTSTTPIPTGVVVHSKSRVLELQYGDESYRVPFELLRVYSPSAEVQGHGPGQETLQTGKREVTIIGIDPVGHYALQLNFSDGHNTGIYSWDILHDLATRQEELVARVSGETGSRGRGPRHADGRQAVRRPLPLSHQRRGITPHGRRDDCAYIERTTGEERAR